MSKRLPLALVVAITVAACGDGGKPTAGGNASGSNPWLEKLDRGVEIDGVKFPSRYDYKIESRKWDWANSFSDYMAEKGDAVFLPGSPAMSNLQTARAAIARIRSVMELHQAILHDRPQCPTCGVKHFRVKRDLLYKDSWVINAGPKEDIYEPHPPAGNPVAAVAQSPEEASEVSKVLASIRTGKLAERDLIDSLNRVDELGRLDDAVRGLERLAKENEKDADLQVTFAIACMVRCAKAIGGNEQRAWASKASEACVAALAKDPDHWLAQTWRALVLMDYGTPEDLETAIALLEGLATKQEKMAKEGRFSRTYRFLGVAYRSAGKRTEAREAWERGLARFPDDPAIRKELDHLERR